MEINTWMSANDVETPYNKTAELGEYVVLEYSPIAKGNVEAEEVRCTISIPGKQLGAMNKVVSMAKRLANTSKGQVGAYVVAECPYFGKCFQPIWEN